MTDPAAPTPAGSAPLTLGRYELLFRFAAGGMAEVYAARSRGAEGFERLVAVKRMLPTLSDDPKFVEMFLDEAKVAANVHSRHVVSTLDLGRASDGSLYIVMDLIRGLSLNRLIKRAIRAGEKLPVDIVSEILMQTARGLHDAHEAATPDGKALQIVHRDVSPQNVLLDRTGAVRLTDFGVARAVERHSRTETGELRGKVAYFAPEQMTGDTIDRRTDIFALGVVAHEMITGARLFRAENAWLTLQQVAKAKIPRVDDVREGVPAALADAVDKALCRDPDGRFATAAEFGDAVREAVTPAGATAVGELVSRLGADYLDALEAKLRKAAAQEPAPAPREAPDPAPAPAVTPTLAEEPAHPTSATAEVPDVVAAAQPVPVANKSRKGPSLAVMVVVPCVVAAAAAFGILWLSDAGEPQLTQPTETVAPVNRAPVEQEAADDPADAPEPPVEPAPEPPTETETSAVDVEETETAPEAAESEPVAPRPVTRPRPRPRPAVEHDDEEPPSEPDPPSAGSSVLMGSELFEQELGGR